MKASSIVPSLIFGQAKELNLVQKKTIKALELEPELVQSDLNSSQYDKNSKREKNMSHSVETKVHEKPWRSLVKTFSWRITATLTTLIISYVITGNLALAGLIGGIEFFSKIFLYYMHERIWSRIHLGLRMDSVPPDYQI